MPRNDVYKYADIHLITSARHPSLIAKACLKTGSPSATAYIQDAICSAIARDLALSVEEVRAGLPPRRGDKPHPIAKTVTPGSASNTNETVV